MKIALYITPGAKKSELAGVYDNKPKIKIAAIAENGKANDELVAFLAKILNIPKSSIKIVSGHTSRQKIIEIININKTETEIINILTKNP